MVAAAEESGNTITQEKKPKVLFLFYSFSGQTVGVMNRLTAGLKSQGVEVKTEKLWPITPLRFPFESIYTTVKMMVITFFRYRMPIKELPDVCFEDFDLIILAGPTWSYSPSGPILSMLDRDGEALFKNKMVLPLISCRGYWRMHWYGLRNKLRKCGASVPNLIVFSHPHKEPWRTVGVFLRLAGRHPERSNFMGKHYDQYGHSKKQRDEAWRFGLILGEALNRNTPISELNFKTPLALP